MVKLPLAPFAEMSSPLELRNWKVYVPAESVPGGSSSAPKVPLVPVSATTKSPGLITSSSPEDAPVHETLPPSAVRLPLAIPSHDATASFRSHATAFVAHGVGMGVGVAAGADVAVVSAAVGVGAGVPGRAVGEAIDPQAARPTKAIAAPMTVLTFIV